MSAEQQHDDDRRAEARDERPPAMTSIQGVDSVPGEAQRQRDGEGLLRALNRARERGDVSRWFSA